MKDGAVKIDISVSPMPDAQFDAFFKDVGVLAEKYDIDAPIVLLFHMGQVARVSINHEVETCGVSPADAITRHAEAFVAGLGIPAVIDTCGRAGNEH